MRLAEFADPEVRRVSMVSRKASTSFLNCLRELPWHARHMESCSVACVHVQRPACWRGRGACERGSEGGLREGPWEPPQSRQMTPRGRAARTRGRSGGLYGVASVRSVRGDSWISGGRRTSARGPPEVRRRSAAGRPFGEPQRTPIGSHLRGVCGRSDRRCARPRF